MDTKELLNIVFGPSSYNSFICISRRKKGENGIFPISYVKSSKLDLQKIKKTKDFDYYITANTLTRRERKSENLFSLRNIVIDIDCHKPDITKHERDEVLQEFIFRMYRDCEIPTPNIIHWTGRGLQLWWSIKETSKILLFLYKKIIEKIITQLEAMKKEYSIFNHIDIDSASKNVVGLFRLFNSWNTKTETETFAEIRRKEKYDINELMQGIAIIDDEKEKQII